MAYHHFEIHSIVFALVECKMAMKKTSCLNIDVCVCVCVFCIHGMFALKNELSHLVMSSGGTSSVCPFENKCFNVHFDVVSSISNSIFHSNHLTKEENNNNTNHIHHWFKTVRMVWMVLIYVQFRNEFESSKYAKEFLIKSMKRMASHFK